MSFDSTAILPASDIEDEPTRSLPVVPPRTDRRPPPPPPPAPRKSSGHVTRGRTYEFVLDEAERPIELGSGRFAKAFLGRERWIESKTAYEREVAIKVMQRGVSREDQLRFQLEKQILERVQGHPNIVQLLASGENDDPEFIPRLVRDRVDNDYMVLERLDMSLEERLKGSRTNGGRDDLLAVAASERLFRVLDYLVPIASAIEFAHLDRDTCHRDLKPANVLLRLPSAHLRGAQMEVKLADFNVGKARDPDDDVSMTRVHTVPGTLYFQSPEQEINSFELLVNVRRGSPDVDYFEDFYIDIFENDMFSLFNQSFDLPHPRRRPDAQEAATGRAVRRGRRDQRARPGHQGGRQTRRHLLARGDVLLPDQRRLLQPQVAVRLVPQVHRVGQRRRVQ